MWAVAEFCWVEGPPEVREQGVRSGTARRVPVWFDHRVAAPWSREGSSVIFATKVPLHGWVRTQDALRRRVMAARVVLQATPYSGAIPTSVGKQSPPLSDLVHTFEAIRSDALTRAGSLRRIEEMVEQWATKS
ncbi:hypothetical protein Ssi02_15760 [Sinosporangium siamense]|uniref:Uncharacterized protein n=1 Tax=Sinosporangium siamense TaxID=1367973 RepID=A0A919RCE3_9ACTN|nr:hypothetical protein Ssi02_15760 [Sinosporangium siamense]